jgi:hypothetical protein
MKPKRVTLNWEDFVFLAGVSGQFREGATNRAWKRKMQSYLTKIATEDLAKL